MKAIFGLILAGLTPLQSQDVASHQRAPAVNDLRYPASALSGRIMGEVTSAVAFDGVGAATSIQYKGYPAFVDAVAAALGSVPPSASCAGQTVAMRFNFVLDQDLDPKTPISIKAVSAFDYEILAPTGWVEVTISDPEWIFTRKGRFLHRVKSAMSSLKFW